MVESSREAVIRTAQYVEACLRPLNVVAGQFQDGNWGFRVVAEVDSFFENDYILSGSWWFWRNSPVPELPSYVPDVRPAVAFRGDGADVAAFIAWQLALLVLPTLSPKVLSQPVTAENRLEHLIAASAAEMEPAVAKRWWSVGTSYLSALSSGHAQAPQQARDDATRWLQNLRDDTQSSRD